MYCSRLHTYQSLVKHLQTHLFLLIYFACFEDFKFLWALLMNVYKIHVRKVAVENKDLCRSQQFNKRFGGNLRYGGNFEG